MKRLLLSLLLASFTMFLFAANVELQDAKNIAKNAYFQKVNTYLKKVDFNAIEIQEYYVINQDGESVLYAFNFKNFGYMLIAADDAIEPVLGYSLSNQYSTEKHTEGFRGVIWEFGDHISYLRSNKIDASPEISQMWSELKNYKPTAFAPKDKDKDIDPLLTCTWNQDWPYNYYCPEDNAGPGGHVYVGCVATAMCQIMQYWRYPEQGNGTHSYTPEYHPEYGVQTVNFGATTYNWDEMVDNSDQKINLAMALVGYHAAVSVDMNFTPNASGAYSSDVPYAMKTYFKYANNVQYLSRQNFPLTSWETYLQLELEDNCPVYYSGQSPDGGHAFVLDGYRESDGFYHFNFGWSGYDNGWFACTDAGGFNSGQGMVKNIEPNDPTYPYGCSPDYELTNMVGSFEDGSGPKEDYDGSASCSWLINPQTAQDSVTKIKLEFVVLDTDVNDIVTIYDGASTSDPVLGEYSGPDAPTGDIYSTGNQMLIVFEANGDGTIGTGFKVEYDSYLPSWCSGNTVLDEPSGTVEDGSGEFWYKNGSNCTWMITPEFASDITLSFTEFGTEEDKDVVKIYDATNNQLLATLSGDELPDPIYNENGALFIAFQSDGAFNGPGWVAEWEIGNTGIKNTENANFNSLKVFPNPTESLLNVSFELEDAQAFNVKLISVTGNVVYQEAKDNFSGHYVNTIDLSGMAQGVYFLSLSNENGSVNRKVVVK